MARLRVKQLKTFQERLAEEAMRFKAAADLLPPGTERDLLLRRVRQAETAAHIDDWLNAGTATACGVENPTGQVRRRADAGYLASLEQRWWDAANAASIRDRATEDNKRELFDRLHRHFNQLADEVERALNGLISVTRFV